MERLSLKVVITVLLISSITYAQSTIEKIGDLGLYSMPLVAFGSTIVNKDFKGSVMFSTSFLLNAGVTFGLKAVIDKERPDKSNLHSFPSAHTSITFQGAAFMQKRYGWKYGIPAYAVAVYTGFSRVHADKHFVEDVFVGAAIGVLSSYVLTKKRIIKKDVYFSFGKNKNDFVINCNYKF